MSKSNARNVITALLNFFSIFGLPTEIVTDNGPPFGSFEFKSFCHDNCIQLTHSPPYHPQSNGIAERAVQTVKRSLKKTLLEKNNNMSLEEKINKFLFYYRNTKSTSTNASPNAMLFAYKTKTVLDALNPHNENSKQSKPQKFKSSRLSQGQKSKPQLKSKSSNHRLKSESDSGSMFFENDKIYYRNHFKNDVKWIPALFLKQISPHTFLIKIHKHKVRMVHRNQFRKSNTNDLYPSNQRVVNKSFYSHQVPDKIHKNVNFGRTENIPMNKYKRKRSESLSPEIPRRSKRLKELIANRQRGQP